MHGQCCLCVSISLRSSEKNRSKNAGLRSDLPSIGSSHRARQGAGNEESGKPGSIHSTGMLGSDQVDRRGRKLCERHRALSIKTEGRGTVVQEKHENSVRENM